MSTAEVIERSSQDIWSMPLEDIDPNQPALFQSDEIFPLFQRLRKEDPVHYTAGKGPRPYWSITRYDDIMSVDTNHEVFSSAHGIGVTESGYSGNTKSGFIAMDPPDHDTHRKTVSPGVGPANLQRMAPLIRQRAGEILDGLPIGEEFDWVDNVSRELTAMTLATLYDVPQVDRLKLTYWSDIQMTVPGLGGMVATPEEKQAILKEFYAYMIALWNKRVNSEPGNDLISMLAHGAATRTMSMEDYIGTVTLLTVGGNDTTRNTISGSALAFSEFPDQWRKLKANPALLPSMVSEAIRWQTPVAHQARTAMADAEVGGQRIRKGEKVVMWYASGNRDESVIDDPDSFNIERERPRNHMAFGFGIHRCVGNRLAELQLSIIWDEILKRFPEVVVTGPPERTYSVTMRGIEHLPVMIPRRH